MGYMQQCHLQQVSRHDIYVVTENFTSVILYMNIMCIAQGLFGANFEILHCSHTLAQRQKFC